MSNTGQEGSAIMESSRKRSHSSDERDRSSKKIATDADKQKKRRVLSEGNIKTDASSAVVQDTRDMAIDQLHQNTLADYDCSICLASISGRKKQLPCSHEFHEPCINTWLSKRNKCPVCREAILPSSNFIFNASIINNSFNFDGNIYNLNTNLTDMTANLENMHVDLDNMRRNMEADRVRMIAQMEENRDRLRANLSANLNNMRAQMEENTDRLRANLNNMRANLTSNLNTMRANLTSNLNGLRATNNFSNRRFRSVTMTIVNGEVVYHHSS